MMEGVLTKFLKRKNIYQTIFLLESILSCSQNYSSPVRKHNGSEAATNSRGI